MGEIVGAGLVSSSPVIMFPAPKRLAANNGTDFTLATGLTRLADLLAAVDHDAVVVLDSTWATTTETVITAHDVRYGVYTSAEMPSDLCWREYDLPGDPELANAVAEVAGEQAPWVTPIDDGYLPIQHGTLNPWTCLGCPDKPWLSVSVCRAATTEDFLDVGAVLAEAVSRVDRRVLLLASGGLSGRLRPLRELRSGMAADPANIAPAQARLADLNRIAWLEAGDHAQVIATMPEYLATSPDAGFGHYLTLAGALGGKACTAPGIRCSEYESGIGTGQVHLWFPRPDHGWTSA